MVIGVKTPGPRAPSALGLGLIEHSLAPMVALEGHQHIVSYANPAFRALFHTTVEQIVGKPIRDFLPEDDDCVELLDRILLTQKGESHIGKRRPIGASALWSYMCWPIFEEERVVGLMLQVTETAKFHEATVAMNEALLLGALRQHELIEASTSANTQLQTEIAAQDRTAVPLAEKARLLDVSNDAIVARGMDDRISLWNKGAEKLYGWSCDEVMGRDLHSFLQTEFPKPQEEIVAQLQRDGQFVGEVVQIGRDGRRISSLCRWVLDRETASILTSYTDISDLKRTQEALCESEERYRSLFTSVPMAVFVCDREAVVQHYNEHAAALWGREPVRGAEQFHGFIKLWLPDGTRLPHAESPMSEVLRTGVPACNVEVLLERPDGSRLPVMGNFAALRDAHGVIKGVITSLMDISERRLLEDTLTARAADLVRADRSKDEFLAMLAHELRNPLAPMRIAAEILSFAGDGTDERQQAQSAITRQIANMSRLVDDLLDVSRITEGKIELRREPVAIQGILNSVALSARSGMSELHQELTVSIPMAPIYVNADATRLEQVFNNLLGNARKYTGQGGHISLSVERGASAEVPEVVVRISDDGIGIAPELLPRVFDLFVQATRALDRASGGLGIGLTLVSRLVRLHGGIVEVRSEGLGHGSEFVVRLPVLTNPVLVEASPATPAVLPPEAARRMLVIDDNVDSARGMATLQSLRGHDTRTAFTGPEAVKVAAEFAPEVVLLDIGLPDMDGFEVARALRAMPALADAFIVAMTGYGSEEDRARAQEAGFDEYLIKPVDLDLLRTWLRSRR